MGITQDVRYAFRRLIQSRLFTFTAIATLALGAGVNAGVFSVVKSVLLEALPYGDARQLVMVWVSNPKQGFDKDITSYPRFNDWKNQSTLIADMAAFSNSQMNLTGTDEPEQLRGAQVTANFFDVLRVKPIAGTAFAAGDDDAARDRKIVLSRGFWARRFGADPGIVGKSIRLNGQPHTVVAVMPASLQFPDRNLDFWVPMRIDQQMRTNRGPFYMNVFGRMKDGVSVAQLQAEMTGIAKRLEQQHVEDRDLGLLVIGLQQELTGSVQKALWLLMGAVFLVLLIACANVAGMLAARAMEREREISIRSALGAGRGRLLGQLLTETVVLFGAGGVAGILFAYWTVRLLVKLAPAELAMIQDTRVDLGVVAFTLGLSFLTGLLFGLGPALQSTRRQLAESLKQGGRSLAGHLSGHLFRRALVVTQVALAVILLSGCGLLIRSFLAAQQVDLGFDASNVLTARLQVPRGKFTEASQVTDFFNSLLQRIQSDARVQSASATQSLLLGRLPNGGTFTIEGKAEPNLLILTSDSVTPDFFQTMGIRLLKGRMFTNQDGPAGPRVVIVNETMAKRYFSNDDPIGKRFKFGGVQSQAPWMTIVGVVADTKRAGIENPVFTESYQPMAQAPRTAMTLVMRTRGDPLQFVGSLRAIVKEIDKDQPLAAVASMERLVGNMIAARRFHTTLLTLFALTALTLAAVGLYGVISYLVSQRRQEIGVRMALGAQPREVVRMVMGQGMKLLVAGAVTGVIAAMALSRLMTGLLFGISPMDAISFSAAALVLIVAAALATWLPARRAAKVDPMIALRYD